MQAARHAQVQQQGPAADRQQQVLGTPFDPVDALPFQPRRQVARHAEAQPVVADDHGRDDTPQRMRRDAAADGLDFGEFGHF